MSQQRLTHAEAARTLLASTSRGTLSTLDRTDGSPYGSLAEFVGTDDGDAIFLLSDLAEHTSNFKEDARASLFLSQGMADGRPLALERVTLVGEIEPVDDDASPRDAYLKAHPHASAYVDFSDFAFWRLRVARVRFIGGFGRMSWVDQETYRSAQPDPLSHMAGGAIEHMNEDHPDALLDYVRAFSDVDEPSDARMVGLDRFGFDVKVDDQNGRERQVRIHFDAPVEQPSQVRGEMVALVERARRELSG